MNLDQSLCFSLHYKADQYFLLGKNLSALNEVHDFRSIWGGVAGGKAYSLEQDIF